MASLVLGAVGGLMFGPIGFLVGSAIGNALFPTTTGPRLTDLRLQGSAYGAMIPIGYATNRSSGQIIWQTDLMEHKHKGKGGPVTFTYSVSFATKIAKGPIAGFLKIFADSTLIWDTSPGATTNNGLVPVTFYLGTEDAQPDPTMVGVLGVGKVPAFRDDAVAVFNQWDVTNYGNRIPNMSFIWFTNPGQLPERVSSWLPPGDPDHFSVYGASMVNGIITIGVYTATGISGMSQEYTEYTFDQQGNQLSVSVPIIMANQPSSDQVGLGNTGMLLEPCANATIGFGHLGVQGAGNPDAASWYYKSDIVAWPVQNAFAADPFYSVIEGMYPFLYVDPDPSANQLFCLGGSSAAGVSWVSRYPAPNSIPEAAPDFQYALTTAIGGYQVTVGDDSCVYVLGPNAVTLHTWALAKFDLELNLLHQWNDGDLPVTCTGSVSPFTVHGGMICFGTTHDPAVANNTGADLYTINSDYTFTRVGVLVLSTQITPRNMLPVIPLSGCLCLTEDGVISICAQPGPVTLESILTDISTRCGLLTVDFSQQGQLVDGYLLTQQTDGKTAVGPLQSTYFVDFVESSGIIRGVNRGGPSEISIPDSDLAAYEPNTTPPPIVTVKRSQEVDLPAIVNVNYLNEGADWQTGTQQVRRQVTMSQAVATIDLVVALFDNHARLIANVLLFEAWQQRTSIIVLTSRQYNYLEPTDVISAHNYLLRVTKKSDVAKGIIQLECVETSPGIYTAGVAGNSTSGYAPTQPAILQGTQLLLLDIPLVTDADNPNSFYAAMAGAIDDTWAGATLYKSIDNGNTYNQIATSSGDSIIGSTSGVLQNFYGGNVFDELSSVTIVVGLGGGALVGASQSAVLSGANEALVGQEILQYKNALLTAPSTYLLSGFLRGRRGTEWAMGTHKTAERFVQLPVNDVPIAVSELNISRLYKAVTLGQIVGTPQAFADTGATLKPYTPVQLGGGINTSGDVTLTWVPRTRVNGMWRSGAQPVIGELTEAYVVQIWESSYTLCARIILVGAVRSQVYTSAQQVTDFGAQQQTIFFSVLELSAYLAGSQAYGSAPGAGSSNNNPTSPIAPYVWVPSVPPPNPTMPVDIALIWPSDSRDVVMTIGQRKVCSFTTGITVPNTGTIAVSEFRSQATPRRCFIATDTGGTNIVPKSMSYGDTATSFIGATDGGAILLASTTYYYIFDFLQADGTLSGPPGTNAETILNLGNVT